MKRYHTPLTFTATATDAATGYPATNVENRYIQEPWRTPDTAGDTLTLTISNDTPTAIMVVGTNAPTLAFNGTCYSSSDAVSSVAWPDGVRFALSTSNFQAGTTVTIAPSGTPTDGASYYWIGAAHIMSASANVTTPTWGHDMRMIDPAITRELSNGSLMKFRTGPRQMIVTGQVRPQHSDDFEQVFRDDGVQILDAEISRTNYVWPVEWLGTEHVRTGEYAADSVQFTFRRVN